MEGSCSTGQSPQWAVVPVEEEYMFYKFLVTAVLILYFVQEVSNKGDPFQDHNLVQSLLSTIVKYCLKTNHIQGCWLQNNHLKLWESKTISVI
jgi:hypothetical protein